MDFQSIASSLTVDQAKNGSLIAIAVCVILLLVILKFISSVVTKIILTLVLTLIGGVAYSQRASLADCAEKISQEVQGNAGAESVNCTFFGQDISIDTAKLIK
jgi:large-conductance mechanosensitive channel